jgi:hypothetical protein
LIRFVHEKEIGQFLCVASGMANGLLAAFGSEWRNELAFIFGPLFCCCLLSRASLGLHELLKERWII